MPWRIALSDVMYCQFVGGLKKTSKNVCTCPVDASVPEAALKIRCADMFVHCHGRRRGHSRTHTLQVLMRYRALGMTCDLDPNSCAVIKANLKITVSE